MTTTARTPAHRPAAGPVRLLDNAVLVVIDVQRGFDQADWWGRRDNPDCEANVAALVTAWRDTARPVVVVRHDSTTTGSPLAPGQDGNELKPEVVEALGSAAPGLLVTKSVNSSFHGEPDLDAWLRARDATQLVVCGIQTNFCCETTARLAANLGYDVRFPLDATHTFDLPGPDGEVVRAEDVARMTATNLGAEFCDVVSTADIVAAAAIRH